jgi:predicted dienelactone hydrolase
MGMTIGGYRMMLNRPRAARAIFALTCLGLGAGTLALPVAAQTVQSAPDPTGRGPYAVANAEYKLPAKRDVLVAPFTVTELWARVYRPTNAKGARPVIMMLHGNHATCGRFDPSFPGRIDDDSTYTDTGRCPEGYVVAPSHDGYAYLANQLASWGYVVVSINANRGINAAWGDDEDFGLNLRRGRLILRHLVQLDRWNTSNAARKVLGFSLRGKLDFNQIGLFGHSRGGEGVRAALTQYRDMGSIWPSQFRNKPQIRALFELAPVDGQTNRVLNAEGAAWNVLLPTCDGDVSDLQGQRVFDRMITARAETVPSPKSMFTVEGTNHNFYNSEWQQSDSQGCYSNDPKQPVVFDPAAAGSEAQRTTALYPVAAFFRAHLGADPAAVFGTLLDPAYRLPGKLNRVTRYRRTYTDNVARKGSIVLDDFVRTSGAGETGVGNAVGGLKYFAQSPVPEHEPTSQFGVLGWDTTVIKSKGGSPFYQANAAAPGKGVSLADFERLEFRVGLACSGYDTGMLYGCEVDPKLNPSGTTNFSIALVSADGFLSQSVPLARYARPLAPVGLSYGPIIIDPQPRPGGPSVQGQIVGSQAPERSEPPLENFGNGHPVLESVRIPLADFGLTKGARVRGVRLTFDRRPIGAIYLGNVRFTRMLEAAPEKDPGPIFGPFGAADAASSPPVDATPAAIAPAPAPRMIPGGRVNRIVRERRPVVTATQAIMSAKMKAAPVWPAPRPVVTMAITVPESLVIGGALLTLRIGDQTFKLGQAVSVPTQGLKAARFILSPAAFDALPQGAAMVLENGAQRFDLGALDKTMLDRSPLG